MPEGAPGARRRAGDRGGVPLAGVPRHDRRYRGGGQGAEARDRRQGGRRRRHPTHGGEGAGNHAGQRHEGEGGGRGGRVREPDLRGDGLCQRGG